MVFASMPRSIAGVDELEFQIIDDGSTDATVQVARSLGIQHVVRIPGRNRRWLGRAFRQGIDNALRQGADIVVNTDGDNQYPSEAIPTLLAPILNGTCDIAIGDRNPGENHEFSPMKRFLQRVGSRAVQLFCREEIPDAVSGFRAYTKRALLTINVITNYTYTVDTLMQAHKKGLDIAWVPIETNKKTRESRLITSLFAKVRKSGATILRLATVYEPFKTFALLSALCGLPAAALIARFLYFYATGGGAGHVQSLVIAGALLVIAFLMFVLGILAELLAVNRSLIEDLLSRVRSLEIAQQPDVVDAASVGEKGAAKLRVNE